MYTHIQQQDPVEYDADLWNGDGRARAIVHIDRSETAVRGGEGRQGPPLS